MISGAINEMTDKMNKPTDAVVDTELPLVVDRVNKTYKGGIEANREISFSVRPGEILGILGPNGAGKTTLVRQITTELMPSSGSIRVFDVDVVSDPIRAKFMMGIVPQEADLHEMLTVRQTLRIFGKLRGLSSRYAATRADELIASLRLEDHRNVPNLKLSGGLKRRVMVGIATLSHPKLIVLDEPTTGLDPQSRRDLWALLRENRERGSAILLTTHYMEEAEALCDRVGVIQHGKLLALDTVPNLRAAHGYEFKVTYTTHGTENKTHTVYGVDDQELVAKVRDKGVRQYSVARTSLEDVYLALTDGEDSDGFTDDA
jgi:ABC-2 type transport system ATP-binding protein